MENRRKPAPPAAARHKLRLQEAIVDYLTRAFPTGQMEEYVDELGDVRSRYRGTKPATRSTTRRPSRSRAADRAYLRDAADPDRARRIEHYGVSAVAATGALQTPGPRWQRPAAPRCRSPRTNLAETTAFMTGAKRILVFSDAGGTGRSHHEPRCQEPAAPRAFSA